MADRVAIVGAVVLVLMVACAVFAPLLTKAYGHGPNTLNPALTDENTSMPIGLLGGASADHWFGVEPVTGRDILARLVYGARTSLLVASLATGLSVVLGLIGGIVAGYYRGWVDSLVSRSMDVFLAFPTLLFSIALLEIFQNVPRFAGLSGEPLRFAVIVFVLGFFGWPHLGRLVRGQVLSLREKDFVMAARSIGTSDFRIITREILPNLTGPILVWATLIMPTYILGEAGLSYLGVGLQPPTASWGQMLSSAGQFYQSDPMYLIWPSLWLFATVLAFNLFGDGLRDALDPKSAR